MYKIDPIQTKLFSLCEESADTLFCQIFVFPVSFLIEGKHIVQPTRE